MFAVDTFYTASFFTCGGHGLLTKMERIYLDNGATTRIDDRVVEGMLPYFTHYYGNPSSLHNFGVEAEKALNLSRQKIADLINADDSKEIIFTGSATEADNIAIKGIAYANKDKGNHIISTKIEHNAVINPLNELEKQGFKVTYLNVDNNGFVDTEQLIENISKNTILVSIIHANHEIGTIQSLEKIGKVCKEKGVLFHTDAAQSFTKTELDVRKFNLDLVSLNAHKIHGPKGIGALYIKKGTKIKPIITGGGQEFKIRSGTENVPSIVGFSKAAEIGIREMKKNVDKMTELRDYFIENIMEIPNTSLNGVKGKNRLCNNVNFTFDFIEGEAMLMHLDIVGIAVSTGSACSSKSLNTSTILKAIGRSAEQANGTLRFTLSKYTTKKEIEITIEKLKFIVKKLRELSPLTS